MLVYMNPNVRVHAHTGPVHDHVRNASSDYLYSDTRHAQTQYGNFPSLITLPTAASVRLADKRPLCTAFETRGMSHVHMSRNDVMYWGHQS